MKVSVDLPAVISVDDYHEFKVLETQLRTLGMKGVKIKELNLNHDTREYEGLVYVGLLPHAVEKEHLARLKKIEMDWDAY